MKLKLIAVAVAALAANSAFAAPVTRAQAAAAPFKVRIAGASAPTATMREAIKQTVCQTAADFTIFNAADSNVKAYACVSNGFGGTTAGTVAVFQHTVTDGSLLSIKGMSANAAQQVNFVDFASCTGGDGTTAVTGCSASKARAHGGLSDVEAGLFKDVLATATHKPAGVDLSMIETTVAGAGQSFGVAVSLPLFRALQARDGIDPAVCTDDFAAECIPSVSKQEYASAVAQQSADFLTDWTYMDNGSLTDADSEKMIICKRPVTSGTQASSNAYFLNKNCSPFGIEPSAPANSTTTLAAAGTGLVVVENSSTGNVKTCLNSGNTAAAGSKYRWGVVSMENTPAAGTDTWRFVKIDGQLSTDANATQAAIDMKYDFFMELVMHTSSEAAITPAAQGKMLKDLAKAMGNPYLTQLKGIHIVPGEYYNDVTPGADEELARVGKSTRGGNNCQPATKLF